jgi:hypothetical protein
MPVAVKMLMLKLRKAINEVAEISAKDAMKKQLITRK